MNENQTDRTMSVTIRKDDTEEKVKKALRKVMSRTEKKSITLEKYLGRVSFEKDGLTYQKEIRNEW